MKKLIEKYRSLKFEAQLLMTSGNMKAYVKKLVEVERAKRQLITQLQVAA